MAKSDEINLLIEKYERMTDEQKKRFHEMFGLVKRARCRARKRVPENVFKQLIREMVDITSQKKELILKWKELQKKLDPNPKDKRRQLKRILRTALDDNLSALEKLKYKKRKGRGYKIFEYARDHAEELGIKPLSDEDMELLEAAYTAVITFPKKRGSRKRHRRHREGSEKNHGPEEPEGG